MATSSSDARIRNASSTDDRPAHRRLRTTVLVALITNIAIVFTGGIVRVTGSGLGCPDWPTCDGTRVAPTPGGDHGGWQAGVEFGNRLMTFVVLAAAIAVWVQIRRSRPHPRSTELLAMGLIAGVLAQAVVGGITVLTGLSPIIVATHFLLSMILISFAAALYERIRETERATDPGPTSAGLRHATTALLVVAAVVLVLGTVVTGAGPHGGDVGAARFGIDIRLAAIAHADAVWALVGITIALVAVTWRSGPPALRRAARLLLVIELLQGAVGYTQYALEVPAALVAVHILGAALMWTVATTVWVRARPLATTNRVDARAAADSQLA